MTEQPGRDWTTMNAADFGADEPAVLFDASDLARGADNFGTPDLFADLGE